MAKFGRARPAHRFDVIVANPPFVAGGAARFAAGGADGRRVLTPLLRGLLAHVAAPDGVAAVASEFGDVDVDGAPAPPGFDALLVFDPRQVETPDAFVSRRGRVDPRSRPRGRSASRPRRRRDRAADDGPGTRSAGRGVEAIPRRYAAGRGAAPKVADRLRRAGVSSVASGLLVLRLTRADVPRRDVLRVDCDADELSELSFLERPAARALVEDTVVRFSRRRSEPRREPG